MQDLGAWVTSKIANAAGPVISGSGQVSCMGFPDGQGLFLKVVVLTIQAIKGTGLVENSQVPVPVFGTFHV